MKANLLIALYIAKRAVFFCIAICRNANHDGTHRTMIGVLFPSKYEAVLFLGRLNNAMAYRMERGFPCTIGELHRKTVSVGIIGMGRPHAARRADLFIEKVKPKRVLLAGFAGGLNPQLRLGDIRIAHGDEPTAFVNQIYTAHELVSTPEDKRRAYEKSGCDIVDMETDDIARVAQAHGVPLTVVRAISDTADELLPGELFALGYDQARGKSTPLRMALHLALHWGDIKRLKRAMAPLPPVREILTAALMEEIQKSSSER